MQRPSVEKRVEVLEIRVDRLQALPERVANVEQQVLQLRGEMHDEFSALRLEMNEGFGSAGAETQSLREEMRVLHKVAVERIDETRTEMHALHKVAVERIAEMGVQMRVLHEDVIGRIAVLGEALNGKRTKRSRKR